MMDLMETVEAIKAEIKDEYTLPHRRPWLIGFSGGKDSTLMLQLVVESLLELPWSARDRKIHVVANDTLVESPIVSAYVDRTLLKISAAVASLKLPIHVQKTVPDPGSTFWVNLIGRGYPPPTRLFRWCTDRMKIRPTTRYIRECVDAAGEVVLLLGVRRSESAARSKTASRYDNGERLNKHNDIQGCFVFRPILEMDTEDVWSVLAETDAPWGGRHRELIDLYSNAAGDDCPLVMDPDAAPSCGSSSVRFGCWTCTVVEKDKSFRASVENGYEQLGPMVDFRDWMKDYCYRDSSRMKFRRNGDAGKGPLTFAARQEVLVRLLELQDKVDVPLISEDEQYRIQHIWLEDRADMALRGADKLLGMLTVGG
jgi:DNA sulfur modification protein DndC